MNIALVAIAVSGAVFVVGFVVSRARPAGSRLGVFEHTDLYGPDSDVDTADRLQMLAAVNERRRRRGLPEIADEELEDLGGADPLG